MKYLLVLFFSTIAITILAQDTLIMYAKPGCGNCEYAKKFLSEKGIMYADKSIEHPAYRDEMLAELKALDYKGRILMPVLLYNRNLVHPAKYVDTGYVHKPLVDVLDSIDHYWVNEREYRKHIISESTDGDNSCEEPNTTYYLVVENFKDKQRAISYLYSLRKTGLHNAGFLAYKKYYRVYLEAYKIKSNADNQLVNNRKKHPRSYLLAIDE